VKYGGYSPGRGRAVDVQQFGPHCVFDFNAYAVQGIPFEGKIRTWTFPKLPGTEFEPHGIQVTADVVKHPVFPDEPARLYDAPDLRLKADAPDVGAYSSSEAPPVYGPRP